MSDWPLDERTIQMDLRRERAEEMAEAIREAVGERYCREVSAFAKALKIDEAIIWKIIDKETEDAQGCRGSDTIGGEICEALEKGNWLRVAHIICGGGAEE